MFSAAYDFLTLLSTKLWNFYKTNEWYINVTATIFAIWVIILVAKYFLPMFKRPLHALEICIYFSPLILVLFIGGHTLIGAVSSYAAKAGSLGIAGHTI